MGLNIFRFVGDMCHVFSMATLLRQLIIDKNAKGISLRSQELYLLVFITRYLDLFTTFYSYYNSVVKVLYIGSTARIIYLIKFQTPINATYDKSLDAFPHWKLAVAPTFFITSIIHLQGADLDDFDPIELMWIFSILLESIAMVPQLLLFYHFREIAMSTAISIAFRGIYRLLYIFNWIFRAYTEPYFRHHWVVYFCAILQTILYIDFFGYFIQSLCSDEVPPSSDSQELCTHNEEDFPESLVHQDTESLLSPEVENIPSPETLMKVNKRKNFA